MSSSNQFKYYTFSLDKFLLPGTNSTEKQFLIFSTNSIAISYLFHTPHLCNWGTSATLILKMLTLYFTSFKHGRAWFILKMVAAYSMYVVSVTQDLLIFFLDTTLPPPSLHLAWQESWSTSSLLSWREKTKLGSFDPLSQGFEPGVSWHKLT